MADFAALTAALRQPCGDLVKPVGGTVAAEIVASREPEVAAGLLEEDDFSLMDFVQEHGLSASAPLPCSLGFDLSPAELSVAQSGMVPRSLAPDILPAVSVSKMASNKITLGVPSASRPATGFDAREGDVEVGDRASR